MVEADRKLEKMRHHFAWKLASGRLAIFYNLPGHHMQLSHLYAIQAHLHRAIFVLLVPAAWLQS